MTYIQRELPNSLERNYRHAEWIGLNGIFVSPGRGQLTRHAAGPIQAEQLTRDGCHGRRCTISAGRDDGWILSV
ncbi:hypothetical protein [Mesorhizobium sp.]|uniref:hypothetical protein n=1 Tax=Mesorhizobium sp. TaxID=1871066 RepID=UPI0025C66515|nr:hypothetical protein [Mesorhizobium sp.]